MPRPGYEYDKCCSECGSWHCSGFHSSDHDEWPPCTHRAPLVPLPPLHIDWEAICGPDSVKIFEEVTR